MHWFTGASDVFTGGGTLVDIDQPWAMRDKVQHFVGGLVLARLLSIVLRIVMHHDSSFSRARYTMTIVLMAAVINELIEVTRMYLWWRRTAMFRMSGWEWNWDAWAWSHPAGTDATLTMAMPATPPNYADSISWKDIVATLLGGLVGL